MPLELCVKERKEDLLLRLHVSEAEKKWSCEVLAGRVDLGGDAAAGRLHQAWRRRKHVKQGSEE